MMDKMRQEVEGKLIYWKKMNALFLILCLTDYWNYVRPISSGENFKDFFQGFQFGISITLLIFALFNVIKYRKILKDEEAIRAFYIKEHDERIAAIREKTGGTVLYTCGLLIILASIIAGYFNPVVFMSVLSCGVFLLIVRKVMWMYYSKIM